MPFVGYASLVQTKTIRVKNGYCHVMNVSICRKNTSQFHT